MNKEQKQEIYGYGYNYIDVQIFATPELHKKELKKSIFSDDNFADVSGFLVETAWNNYEEYANSNSEVPEITKDNLIAIQKQVIDGATKAIEDNKQELKKLFWNN